MPQIQLTAMRIISNEHPISSSGQDESAPRCRAKSLEVPAKKARPGSFRTA